MLDGKPLTPAEIVKLADLESREVLLAKLAGAMKASLSGAAGTFAALPAQMARLLGALEAKRAAEGPTAPPSRLLRRKLPRPRRARTQRQRHSAGQRRSAGRATPSSGSEES